MPVSSSDPMRWTKDSGQFNFGGATYKNGYSVHGRKKKYIYIHTYIIMFIYIRTVYTLKCCHYSVAMANLGYAPDVSKSIRKN